MRHEAADTAQRAAVAPLLTVRRQRSALAVYDDSDFIDHTYVRRERAPVFLTGLTRSTPPSQQSSECR